MILPEFSEYFQGEARMHLLSILELSLAEDGPDLTTEGVFGPGDRLQAIIVAKEQTIIAGLPVIPLVMDLCAAHPEELSYTWQSLAKEGEEVAKGSIVARISGPARQVLRAERVILNFVSHLCGIANLTRRYAEKLEGTGVRLLDTRKTMPGLRYPDKYAVLCGGGHNHRRNLAEMLMLKDNHIDAAGSMTKAVELLRGRYNPCPPIEVECRNLDEINEAVACRVDRIMLDNMTPDMLPEALEMIPSFIETEISGGVSLDTIRAYATVSTVRKPDFISVGRITHSAVTADLSMRIAKESL
ncbi:carboxylating nicotinate-nucleotide diphosphorylase [Bilophila wadsworthia]|jgi:nicotinate-nucleotide pyrophosphorylase (carboxylating)|uniref:carboxylating nicotinate-nucleotide diphosphorylase n=1 Tax=Bilophila wadsworthia TaxID=35833 RepID=UPI001DA56613|nr:carboxylating nicotinate-nucleotide diphosphorylase [Bilophila wadsworthia]MBS5375582.1 carboxylating nicotinate-nucleotide diphosphorylase [Bilophila wadsworthia]